MRSNVPLKSLLNAPRRALGRLRSALRSARARREVLAATRHHQGPRHLVLGDDEVAVVCLLRNGTYWLDELLRHHRALGVRHFLFIDNGSTDGTLAALSGHPDVSVAINELAVADYESRLRSVLARSYFKGGWLLFVDSDELIEMVNGAGRPISDYARYCNRHGYTAVVGQCLDMFSDLPLSQTRDFDYARSIALFDKFSLEQISVQDYHDPTIDFAWFLVPNIVTNPAIKMKFGGIRREVFGEDCALTNHRMVRNLPGIGIYTHAHACSHVTCADFTLLLRHYKFAGAFVARETAMLEAQVWRHGEGRKRLERIGRADFLIRGAQDRRFRSARELVDLGFLTASETFFRTFPDVSMT